MGHSRMLAHASVATPIDLTASIPNTAMIGVWRIDPSGHSKLKGLADDPFAATAARQAPLS